jgi:transforming growth factor-beta-induced protein
MRKWTRWFAALGAAMFLAACGDSDEVAVAPGTLAEEATARGFGALVAAADKAGLVDALASASSDLTVFAPTDAAFDTLATRLGFADATAMVNALDGATLAKILQYHVLPSRKSAADLTAGVPTQATLYAFNGAAASLALSTTAGVQIRDAVLNQATVTTADVAASNGVIHVIDAVLVPPGVLTIVQMAQANPIFSTLVQAVVTANLAGTLGGAGPLTVFAPTDAAFASTLNELSLTAAQLLASPDLAGILTYHAVAGAVRAADVVALPKPAAVTTVQGDAFAVDAALNLIDGRSRTAGLVATDIEASNGVIHVIDNVLLPPVAN